MMPRSGRIQPPENARFTQGVASHRASNARRDVNSTRQPMLASFKKRATASLCGEAVRILRPVYALSDLGSGGAVSAVLKPVRLALSRRARRPTVWRVQVR